MKLLLLKCGKDILIIALVAGLIFSMKTCRSKNSDIKVLRNAVDSSYNVAKYVTNKNKELVGQVKTQELTIGQLKKFTEELGYNKKKLEGKVNKLSRIVAHWEGQIKISIPSSINPVGVIDTSDWKASNMDFSMDLDAATTIQEDSFKIIDFSLTAYYVKNGLFKKKQLVADIFFEDPNFRVQEFKGFVIQQPKIGYWQTPIGQITIGLGAFGLGYLAGKGL